MKTFHCHAIICPEPEEVGNGHWAYVANLPGVVSQGDTFDEALYNISDAFHGAITAHLERGEEIPWSEIEANLPEDAAERKFEIMVSLES